MTQLQASFRAALGLSITAALGLAACSGLPDADEEAVGQAESPIQVGSDIYNLIGLQSGKCAEVQGGSTANLARLDIATCNGSTRQQFRAKPRATGSTGCET